ncbi:Ribosome maturation factor RimM [Rhodocyclaceae bacterium]|nr:Ribosome maturation factor RimM [Rhodocyclaceae bacterium]
MIVLGRIVAPYGVKGWVKLAPFGDDPAAWCDMRQWWLGPSADGDDWSPRALKGLRVHGKGVVAKFEGVDDRSAAEQLDGLYVAAPRDALPQTAKDEYYWGDLVGLEVVNVEGAALGTVASLVETGANAVLVVRDGDSERLLPFIAQVVKGVDMAERRIRVEWGTDW